MKNSSLPLSCLDVHLTNYRFLNKEFIKDNDISKLVGILNISYWSSDIIEKIFQKDYDALVLTDKNQKILWVSNGFKNMTGYSKTFAVGKKPSFLQGERTSKSIKRQIRVSLKNHKSFCGSLLNYKKNGSLYNCQIKISLLYNSKQNLKYFLAFEKEIPIIQ
jgi:PAS domain S-box-containing protein